MRMPAPAACLVAAGLPLFSLDGIAHEGGAEAIEEVVVYARARSLIGEASSASSGVVGYDDIDLPPLLRVGELVEAVPGMVATQHSGTGKANQYFIRGFNLDHGTDFAVSVEGVPVNMRTHGHGQGYLDINFIIPELVATTEYARGPYSARVGDFSSAASVDFDFYDDLDPLVSLTAGAYGYGRALAGGSTEFNDATVTGALELTRYGGPWDLDEDLEQYKFFAAYDVAARDDKRVRVTLQGYDNAWQSTDQVPQRAISSGLISERGFIDPDLGGNTSRYALTASIESREWLLTAYAIDYDLTLYSNFTYLLSDPVNGDEFEQRDSRQVYGISLHGGTHSSDSGWTFDWGGEARFDDIDKVGLYQTDARVRIDTLRQDSVDEWSVGAWGEFSVLLSERLRAILGLRADHYDWDVAALRDPNSGTGNDTLVSPKASLAWTVSDSAEAYVNYGQGFHSNDVRGATISIDPATGEPADPVNILVGSEGAEIGLRLESGARFNATLTAFWLQLDSELVYVGDAGSTEENGATTRRGFEGAIFWQPLDWLAANFAYTTTHARFDEDTGGGTRIPGAVESTLTLGLNAAWKSGWRASARVRWLSEAPLVEDNSVRSGDSLLVNVAGAYRTGNIEYRAEIFNLFDADDADISYYYASRLPGEPADGVEDTHLHPLEPRSVRASVTYFWQ